MKVFCVYIIAKINCILIPVDIVENLFTALKSFTINKNEFLKDITNKIYMKVKDKFKSQLGVTFADDLLATKNLNLKHKKSKYTK